MRMDLAMSPAGAVAADDTPSFFAQEAMTRSMTVKYDELASAYDQFTREVR